MRQFTSLQVAILALGSLCFSSAYAGSTLVPMSDAELSATRGQALMSMSYIALPMLQVTLVLMETWASIDLP